jgi:hypothetical protein
MTETATNRGKFRIATDNLSTADFRMCYFTGTATGTDDPDLNTVADLEAVTGVTVAAERVALTNESVTEDDTNNRVNVDADTVAFSAAPGVTAQGAAIYIEGASDAARDIIGIYTTGFPQPVDGGMNVNIPGDFLRIT